MAGIEAGAVALELGSYDTALAIIPPEHLWGPVDRLRMLYDKAYQKWPPHINLIYPFVHVHDLDEASDRISSHLKLQDGEGELGTLPLTLDAAGVFAHRRNNTIFLRANNDAHTASIRKLRQAVLTCLAQTVSRYEPHMTVAQSEDQGSASHKFLFDKVGFVPPVSWDVEELCILVRERTQWDGGASNQMKLWGTISLRNLSISRRVAPLCFYEDEIFGKSLRETDEGLTAKISPERPSLNFVNERNLWLPHNDLATQELPLDQGLLKVASYNVLAEFEYPPSQTRYATITRCLLEITALSDVLILQEVTDDFLCHLLHDENIRQAYKFVSNAPPDQDDIEPLPSHLNTVVLSKWSFTWDWISFRRKHKGSLILRLDKLGKHSADGFIPVVIAAIHLTRGLTDGSVAAKKVELQTVLKHLATNFPQNPWILAGDFNIATSRYTIDTAVQNKDISSQTAKHLAGLENMLVEYGFTDAWTRARIEGTVATSFDEAQYRTAEIFQGEDGATFDPMSNKLAAELGGSGFNIRPQRYDRILVKDAGMLTVRRFNMFANYNKPLSKEDLELPAGNVLPYGSDHWGIRCSLSLNIDQSPDSPIEPPTQADPITVSEVPELLAETVRLRECLLSQSILPTEADRQQRAAAFKLLQEVLQEAEDGGSQNQSRSGLRFVVLAVGSYGLGVWHSTSDIDCLCIGPISSSTFFSLAHQRLRKAATKDVKLLRRVNANSGTMMELEVMGIKMDLQYCPSALIADTWPRAMDLPANSPVFALPLLTLSKLKPARDLYYLHKTIPDFATFRTAYHVVATWAKQRGIYSARFGYLGGIHIAILLVRVYKLLGREIGAVSAPALLLTFFKHYAQFDWKTQMAFDPFFHKRPLYVRTAREPMVILGFHAPSLNVAHAASPPTVRTISEEFQRADALLSTGGPTWSHFLGHGKGISQGASEFVNAFKSFVQIDVQFWGFSLAKGSQFVGWLESRCVMLLVDLNRRLPDVHARIWPGRMVKQGACDANDSDKDYQGCYLIGLDKADNLTGSTVAKEDLKITLSTLQTVLQKFEGQIRGDEKYFDGNCCWMSATVVKRAELGEMESDTREWGEYILGEDESGDEEDEDMNEALTGEDTDEENRHARPRKLNRARVKEVPVRLVYDGKFRSSVDVINRIRWDPAMDSGDYIVGYEDRFLGPKERPLDQWKAEQTDEEFIPQHRILYFKRRSDGLVVWDRKSRRDQIFGSGIKDAVIEKQG
ncbi:hypothetical protein BX600DRAFT_446186 [Xylariales sp. PMI_506]|nr:hypothetical protein BX600DRAFT_446186 [Xylariales sp. PMI_506]